MATWRSVASSRVNPVSEGGRCARSRSPAGDELQKSDTGKLGVLFLRFPSRHEWF